MNNQESLVVVQKDDGEFLDEKDEKKTEKSPEKHDRTLEKRIVNVDRNQVNTLYLPWSFLIIIKKVYLDFKEKEGKEYNDAIIHNNVNIILKILIHFSTARTARQEKRSQTVIRRI